MNQKIAQNIFVHHVFFYLKNPSSVADKNKLLEGLQNLATIECIRFSDIGTPAATNRSVIERDYKRFKSFEYNKDVEIKEYLFCLRKTDEVP